jgi:hypothetical protein
MIWFTYQKSYSRRCLFAIQNGTGRVAPSSFNEVGGDRKQVFKFSQLKAGCGGRITDNVETNANRILLLVCDGVSCINMKAGVFPGAHLGDEPGSDEVFGNKQLKDVA